MDQFPQMLYRAPGVEEIHGQKLASLIVHDAVQLEQAQAEGWHDSTTGAVEAHAAKLAEQQQRTSTGSTDQTDDAPPTREELERKANELGIEFSPRIGDEKLAERIAAKLAEQPAQ